MTETTATVNQSPFLSSVISTIMMVSVIYGFAWLYMYESGQGDISNLDLFALSDSPQDLTSPDVPSTEDTSKSGWFGIDIGKALWGLTINIFKFVFGILLDILSWLTPFSIIRLMFKMLIEPADAMLYKILNLFILRPAGLISFAYMLNWAVGFFKISKD